MNTTRSHPSIDGVILAAGRSRRFGSPKPLVPLNHKPMIEWVLDHALESRLPRIVVVLGCEYRRIFDCLGEKARHPRIQVVINPSYEQGLSSSLKCGLEAVSRRAEAVMFLLGDQPLVDAALINILIERFGASAKGLCVPVYRGKRGNPCIFARRYFDKLMRVRADRGGREVIQTYSHDVLEVEVDAPTYFKDIDTLDDVSPIVRCIRWPNCT